MSYRKSLLAVILLFVTLLSIAFPAQADVFTHPSDGKTLLTSTLKVPTQRLANTQVLQGNFIHRKHLSEIPQPLTSTGAFYFARELGVHWHTKTPFESVFVLTKNGLVQHDEGTETMRMSSDEQPAVRIIANVFFALFTLDVDALEKNFDLYSQTEQHGTSSQWTIGLRPKSTAIASVFKEAIIIGGSDVEHIVLFDKRGDRTEIELRDVQYSSAPASAEIRALFAVAKK